MVVFFVSPLPTHPARKLVCTPIRTPTCTHAQMVHIHACTRPSIHARMHKCTHLKASMPRYSSRCSIRCAHLLAICSYCFKILLSQILFECSQLPIPRCILKSPDNPTHRYLSPMLHPPIGLCPRNVSLIYDALGDVDFGWDVVVCSVGFVDSVVIV